MIFVALELFRIKVSIFSVFTILSQIYSTLSVTNPNTLDVGKYQIENLATLVNFRERHCYVAAIFVQKFVYFKAVFLRAVP